MSSVLLLAAVIGAPAAHAADHTLSTTTAAGNGNQGNMFALAATTELHLTGFELYVDYADTACHWEVYTSATDYTTIDDDSAAWTLVDSGSFAPSGTGDVLVDISLTAPVVLGAGTTTSVYVTLTDDTDCGLNYTNGSAAGAVYASDANLSIDEGYGITYPFAGTFSPRIFNGGVHYRSCETGFLDSDGDGYGDPATSDCHFEGTVVADDTDCDDGDATIHPGASETWYDGFDSDCLGDSDYDADMDGQDSTDWSGTDCDDSDASIYAGAPETWYDGIDADCGEDSDYDADMDGQDSVDWSGEDCDDADASIYAGAPETWYDGIDADCGEDSDYDADLDGVDSADHGGEDCDDANSEVYPGAEDLWYDGVDADCAGNSDFDADRDGFDAESSGGEDCDDTAPDIRPDAEDLPDDGIDQDCDGADATTGGSTGGDGSDGGTDGTDGGADGAGDDADGGADGADEGGKDSAGCASVGPRPGGLLWAFGLAALLGLGRRRR